ncbi:hypothetical protein H4R34_002399 [Dimargaris verticillata]|uniref:Eukaryotic translation initiation factor 3 subunit H n=1 Tax=Dimargaris verticillata TaxID=2761393 RepID=A0A9W8B864_9FUNG|nr:hypothetical protein H4R34_002399 [Dimargaris verticillata]
MTTLAATLSSQENKSLASIAANLDVEMKNPITSVQIEALVVMKIIKHSRESLSGTATGQLLGMDVDDTLNISSAYPAPPASTESPEEIAQYHTDMMQCLREVNVDNNTVGCYQSAHFNTIMDAATIDTMYNYQKNLKKAVMLVYDLSRATRGQLSLRAYRLTPEFMEVYAKGKFTTQTFTLTGLSHKNLLEELPVVIHNSSMLKVLMQEFSEPSPIVDPLGHLESSLLSAQSTAAPSHLDSINTQALELSLDPAMEKNLESILDGLEKYNTHRHQYQYWQRGYAREQQKIQQYVHRRRMENAQRVAAGQTPLAEETEEQVEAKFNLPKEPSRLAHALATGKVDNYCKELSQYSGPTLSKMFAVRELQK